jgi:diaminopimelate epimerase
VVKLLSVRAIINLLQNRSNIMNYLHANGCGNTFLIFDFIDKEYDCSALKKIKEIHEKEGYSKIDSCLLLSRYKNTDHCHDDESLIIEMDVFERHDIDIEKNKFCGNGARVISQYLHEKYNQQNYFIKKNDTLIQLNKKNNIYGVEMGKAFFIDNKKKFYINDSSSLTIFFEQREFSFFYVYVNEPHIITFVPLERELLYKLGVFINTKMHAVFPCGVNVNAINIISDSVIGINTYERGVENLTQACGTGSTSAAALVYNLNIFPSTIENIIVINPGGELVINQINMNFYLFGNTHISY